MEKQHELCCSSIPLISFIRQKGERTVIVPNSFFFCTQKGGELVPFPITLKVQMDPAPNLDPAPFDPATKLTYNELCCRVRREQLWGFSFFNGGNSLLKLFFLEGGNHEGALLYGHTIHTQRVHRQAVWMSGGRGKQQLLIPKKSAPLSRSGEKKDTAAYAGHRSLLVGLWRWMRYERPVHVVVQTKRTGLQSSEPHVTDEHRASSTRCVAAIGQSAVRSRVDVCGVPASSFEKTICLPPPLHDSAWTSPAAAQSATSGRATTTDSRRGARGGGNDDDEVLLSSSARPRRHHSSLPAVVVCVSFVPRWGRKRKGLLWESLRRSEGSTHNHCATAHHGGCGSRGSVVARREQGSGLAPTPLLPQPSTSPTAVPLEGGECALLRCW